MNSEPFRRMAHKTLALRDRVTGNPHELYKGATEATAVRILQGQNANPWIYQDDVRVKQLLTVNQRELLATSELWFCRISQDGKSVADIRTDETYWIKFQGDNHLNQAKALMRTTQAQNSWTLLLELQRTF